MVTPSEGDALRWIFAISLLFFTFEPALSQRVDFQRDIRPILSDACYHCHGSDEETREADLRLDTEEGAKHVVGETDGVVTLLERVRSSDADSVMPPVDSGKSLTKDQVELLSRWVEQGAEWKEHWSFVPPTKSPLPERFANDSWVKQPFDAFVLERLATHGLRPSPPANRNTLMRRLSLDLTGLPPDWRRVQKFVDDRRPKAYEKAVDRLLASKHFGERMAVDWLDAARYADTDGYQADSTRTNWPWRDWVVRAFNENMPFDQFTVEQFAGDLLPNASDDQILATCFHRNHMTNGEGGRDPEESRVDYVIDRVNTMGTVWLGLTLGCTQCHSHKYDPITHHEYYALNAFFNSIDEDGKAGGGAKPFYQYSSDQQLHSVANGLADSEVWLARMEMRRDRIESDKLEAFPSWIEQQQKRIDQQAAFSSWDCPPVESLESTHGAQLSQASNGEILAAGPNARHDDYRIAVRPDKLSQISGMRLRVLPNAANGKLGASEEGHFILTNLKINIAKRGSSQVREVKIETAVADYEKEKTGRSYGPVKTVTDDDPRSGWTSLGTDPAEPRVAIFGFDQPLQLANDEYLALEFRHRSLMGHVSMRRFKLEFTEEIGPALKALNRTPLERLAEQGDFEKLDDNAKADLREQFLVGETDVASARREVQLAQSRRDAYRQVMKPVKVMVLGERKEQRATHVLLRGEWDKKGDTVSRGVPGMLPPIAGDASNPTRLDLARWLVSNENPLTARVVVNRIWQMLLGHGLVRTPEDFGSQGELPTHPRVLDWLAVEFVESGWDVKHIVKLIVMSSTYEQSSNVDPELLARDPDNRLLARNTRFRMPSWMIRDVALRASGLMDDRLGGPPVYPHQPPGAWADATMGRFHYESSVGGDLYRRSLYSFWRRSVAPTPFFDASKRRNCEVRQIRTNTPLHALNLLNDDNYVEASHRLAIRAIEKYEAKHQRIRFLFRSVLCRTPSGKELRILAGQLDGIADQFSRNANAAAELARVGQGDPPKHVRAVDLATYMMLSSTILNLDEAITRE